MIQSDEPEKDPNKDLLHRIPLARVIADEIRNIDASEGFVLGILGPWGSGKTTLIYFVRAELAKEPTLAVLEFNPWMFSGTDDLVERFFVEVSEQLGQISTQFEKVAVEFSRYSRIIAPLKYFPVAGSVFEGVEKIGELIQSIADERKGGVDQQRNRLRAVLSELDAPIIVVIDDIDRLRTDEIRDIFKLVRLTGNFPNIIYVVAFDRLRVENALSADGLSGRDYLEKIIQAAYDVPVIPSSILIDQLVAAINQVLQGINDVGPFDEVRWANVLTKILQPLLRNMRDVRRFAASLGGTVRSVDGKVALVDVLALEAVRVFMPDLFTGICQHQDSLTGGSGDFLDEVHNPERKEAIEDLLARTDRKQVAEAVFENLFPAAIGLLNDYELPSGSRTTWSKERRVADPKVLAYFCERLAGSRLQGQWAAEQLVQVLGNKDRVAEFFSSTAPSTWGDIIISLPLYEDRIPVEATIPASIALANLVRVIPNRQRTFLEPEPKRVIMGVVYRLLRRLPTEEDRLAAVRAIWSEIHTLGAKLNLLLWIEPAEDSGFQLVDPSAIAELQATLRDEIRTALPEVLAADHELFWLVSWITKNTPEGEEPFSPDFDSQMLVCELVRYGITQQSTQEDTGRIKVDHDLHWDYLLGLFGSVEALRDAAHICAVRTRDPALELAVQLVDKRLSGSLSSS